MSVEDTIDGLAIIMRKRGRALDQGDVLMLAQAIKELRKGRPASAVPETATSKDDVPLRCELVNGAIEFVIGAKVLAHATNICPALYDAENDRGRYSVTDPAAFAADVLREINHEKEDGSTILTDLLDKAVERAIEQGAEGVEERSGGPDGSQK